MSSELAETQFAAASQQTRAAIEQRLQDLLTEQSPGPETIREALDYTLLGSGKRLRPLLCVWTHEALAGSKHEACVDVACAIECLHTYSLIHDDLPCMDDDDMRRGKPSCHKQFGEAIAVLTGDALLTMCFDIIASLGERRGLSDQTIVAVIRVIAHAAGSGGLIAGQVLDLVSQRLEPTVETVEEIHLYKTAALISASMEAGAILAAVDDETRHRVAQAGRMAGQAFQIVDDVLDVQTDVKTLGKTPGKDAKVGKLTYPALVGVEASRHRAAGLIEDAKARLGECADGSLLGALLDVLVKRSK
ncbi:MAG: polyprenyl synthetase family protein [Candidatus Krumholzibacteria bacterium]|nr:polyprenyl synthetase family protein [Candidatus Krumholzibacteria bacterium]